MKNLKLKFLALSALMFFAPIAVFAYTTENGNSVYVAESKTIAGNYYASGANITIDGKVTGDVFCAGQSITINGTVDGDVFCAGQSISINGKVGGSLRMAASDINIRGNVARGITVAASNVNIEKTAQIGWDVLMATANGQIRGTLGRSLLGAGANYALSGKINGDVDLYLNSNMRNKFSELTIHDDTSINGNLTYFSKSVAEISDKAQIKGEVSHKTPPIGQSKKHNNSALFGIFIVAILSALVVGTIIISLWKNAVIEMTDNMTGKFWPTLGWGVIFTIITPLVALLMAITIIGIRLTLITIWTWLILLMLSKIIVAITIGRQLLKKFWMAKKDSLTSAMIIGIIITWLIFYIPVLGWLVSMIAVWWGMGGLVTYLKTQHQKQ